MDQSLAKRTLQELIKREDLKNKTCVDCGNPNPQWASLRFALSFRVTRCPIVAICPASPYLFACNALGFTEVSACTSGEFVYVHVFFLGAFSTNPLVNSFVRSVSMDTWQEDQVRRMQVRQMNVLSGPFFKEKKRWEEMAPSLNSCSHTPPQCKVVIRMACQSTISIAVGRRHSIGKRL
jgi:hypothetical protein